jgi:hypothetical protein
MNDVLRHVLNSPSSGSILVWASRLGLDKSQSIPKNWKIARRNAERPTVKGCQYSCLEHLVMGRFIWKPNRLHPSHRQFKVTWLRHWSRSSKTRKQTARAQVLQAFLR